MKIYIAFLYVIKICEMYLQSEFKVGLLGKNIILNAIKM